MRHIQLPVTTLGPRSTVTIHLDLTMINDLPKNITLVGVRWEPVWASGLSAAEQAWLEDNAIELVQ